MPQSNAPNNFESLTVIFALAVVVSIASLIVTLPAWEGQAGAVRVSGAAAKGYAMPAHLRAAPPRHSALTPEQGGQQAFRAAFNEPQSELERKVTERFQQAVALLHAKRYDYAITALDSVLAISPNMPEAYVNMGYAFLGLEEFGPARGAFEKAIDLKIDQVNAYYGVAIAFEGLKQYEAALGAMRSYIHLSQPGDAHLAKARSALWEWEAQLGRIKGVAVAAEGELVPQMPKPSWSQQH